MDNKLENFERAFSNGTGGCRRECACGKEYYDGVNDYDWEEGELERLEKSGAIGLDHSCGDIGFEGKEYVNACKCWHERAKKLMAFLDGHAHKIAEYLVGERAEAGGRGSRAGRPMIERGITMTGENPALILADLKTHSRRVIDRNPAEWKFIGVGPCDPENFIFESRTEPGLRESETCPYGQKGDRLYVRETFAMRSDIDWREQPAKARHYTHYKADRGNFDPKSEMNFHDWDRWRSPRFMPKCLSRTKLEIVEPVRVERLQDISQADAIAEGLTPQRASPAQWIGRTEPLPLGTAYSAPGGRTFYPPEMANLAYRDLWEQIHGSGEWERNPWVWVLIFKKL